MVSPAAAIRRYSLSRLLSTLIPTAFILFGVATCCYVVKTGLPTSSIQCREHRRQSKGLRCARPGETPQALFRASSATIPAIPHSARHRVRPLQGVAPMRCAASLQRTLSPSAERSLVERIVAGRCQIRHEKFNAAMGGSIPRIRPFRRLDSCRSVPSSRRGRIRQIIPAPLWYDGLAGPTRPEDGNAAWRRATRAAFVVLCRAALGDWM